LRRAQEHGHLDVRVLDLREYAFDRHRTVDDTPYGGGAGMILKVEPIARAVESLNLDLEPRRWILTSPRGRRFDHRDALELSRETTRLVFLCGHYEGLDERIRSLASWDEMSIGDFVLTGGELAALVMLDAAIRFVPGVLGAPSATDEDSFAHSLLEYPHYTRPAEFRGMRVPEVLLSGHHAAIQAWRREQSLIETSKRRPDLIARANLTDQERRRLESGTKPDGESARAGASEGGCHESSLSH